MTDMCIRKVIVNPTQKDAPLIDRVALFEMQRMFRYIRLYYVW